MAKLMFCTGIFTGALLLTAMAAAQAPQPPHTEWRADFSRESCYLWTTIYGNDPGHLVNVNFLRFREGAALPLAVDIQKHGGKPGELVLMILSPRSEPDSKEEPLPRLGDAELKRIETTDPTTMSTFFIGEPHSSEALENLEKGVPLMLSAAGPRRTTAALQQAEDDKLAFAVRLAQSRACWDVISRLSSSN